MDYSERVDADVKLIILKALYGEPDYQLNSSILLGVLEDFGHRKSHDYIVEQLTTLEEQKALNIKNVGSIHLATLANKGKDHVEMRVILEGVARPRPGE